MVDGKLLLMYRYNVGQAPDFDDPCNFVPSYGEAENMHVISPQDIVCPDDPTESTYTVTALLSEDGSQVLDIHAIFDCVTVTYVSKDTIYFASPKSNYTKSSILDNARGDDGNAGQWLLCGLLCACDRDRRLFLRPRRRIACHKTLNTIEKIRPNTHVRSNFLLHESHRCATMIAYAQQGGCLCKFCIGWKISAFPC